MEYLNDDMKANGWWWRGMTMPHLYFATSIKDFLDTKEMVRPTLMARFMCKHFFHGPSIGDYALHGAGVIVFYNLRHSVQGESVLLEDVTGSLEARIPTDQKLFGPNAYLESLREQGIGERDCVQCAEVLYYPEDGSREMWGVRKLLNIPRAEPAPQELTSLVFSPALGF